ncbi:putative high-affinity nickel-transporter (Nickel/cobalt transporter, high-affinity 72-194) [Magnetospirillum sp. XM-1]|uniref:nickel/cobalt transporter n=1 Tax=Magnetospirillum sp. XM-1 TaxID=1663591 RepID=UPI00073E0970|nr:ABC transporter [Magnetospirillum sp. XM-1]CUW38987.1 putative high-affinity nickel-transporter (Nickel/cobalt transporter, high-affinity 72-194) [Magnetospirillum sp. XM-1]
MRLIILVLSLVPTSAWAALVPGGGAPASGSDLPEPLRSIASWGFALQRQLTGQLREQLAVMKETGSWEPAAAIIAAAFLYGVFHAVGPGHGKVVIGGWFASRRARIVHGLAASLIAAMVQAGSAILAVGVLAGILSLAPRTVSAGAAWLEVGSFAMIAAIGALMTWRTLTGKGCGHDHGHHHHHDGACCGHHHHDRHDGGKTERNALFAMAAAVGFRPCSGAILVLLFCFANGMVLIGVLATLAMGIGVAVTVAAIGLGALGLNRLVERGLGESSLGGRVRFALALGGALSITGLGLVLLLGTLINGPTAAG